MDHPTPGSEKVPLEHAEGVAYGQRGDPQPTKKWVGLVGTIATARQLILSIQIPGELQPLRAFGFAILLVLLAAAIEGIWAANLRNGGKSPSTESVDKADSIAQVGQATDTLGPRAYSISFWYDSPLTRIAPKK